MFGSLSVLRLTALRFIVHFFFRDTAQSLLGEQIWFVHRMKCAATVIRVDLTIWDSSQVEHGAGNIRIKETGIDSFGFFLTCI